MHQYSVIFHPYNLCVIQDKKESYQIPNDKERYYNHCYICHVVNFEFTDWVWIQNEQHDTDVMM